MRFEVQLVQPVLVDGGLELRVEGDEVEGRGGPGEVGGGAEGGEEGEDGGEVQAEGVGRGGVVWADWF